MKPKLMKPLKRTWNAETTAYMNMRAEQNLASSKKNPNENWMAEKLKPSGFKWRRSVQWGYRVFDFWCHHLGIAVEVDGPEHDIRYDNYRDEYNYRRSGILVLRVRNWCEEDANAALSVIVKSESWADRKKHLGILGNTKAAKRRLVTTPSYFPSTVSESVLSSAPKVHTGQS